VRATARLPRTPSWRTSETESVTLQSSAIFRFSKRLITMPPTLTRRPARVPESVKRGDHLVALAQLVLDADPEIAEEPLVEVDRVANPSWP